MPGPDHLDTSLADGESSRDSRGVSPPRRAVISVVVPVHNRRRELEQCLAGLRAQRDVVVDLIVVDDGSSEDCAGAAQSAGARVHRLPGRSGAAAARNCGAREARADILLFIDADVVAPPTVARRALDTLADHPGVDAVFGSYDAAPPAPGVVSRFRNLLHHYTHQNGNREAFTFWAGCGAIRRAAFDDAGGFDGAWEAIEDIELGYRLRARGRRILLDPAMQVTHLKRWTLASMVRTDLFGRALPWSRLLMARGASDDLNVRGDQKLSVLLSFVAAAALLAVFARPGALPLATFAAAVLAVLQLNRDFYAFLRRTGGTAFAAACVPLHMVYFLTAGLGFAWARLERAWSRVVARPAERTAG